jgi:hypothetical protein
VAYFLDTDGFKAVSANGVVKIGDGKVDNWFLARLGLWWPRYRRGGGRSLEQAHHLALLTSDANAAVFDSALGLPLHHQ